jgi:hypothetical protein
MREVYADNAARFEIRPGNTSALGEIYLVDFHLRQTAPSRLEVAHRLKRPQSFVSKVEFEFPRLPHRYRLQHRHR